MQKLTVTYSDSNNEIKTDDFYFHLTAMELVDMEATDSVSAKLERITKNEDMIGVFNAFKDIVVASYGVRTDQGQFYKTEKDTAIFKYGNACDEVVFKLLTDSDLAAEFVKNVIPKDVESRFAAGPQDHKEKKK